MSAFRDRMKERASVDDARRAEQSAILRNDPEFQRLLRENGGFNVGGMVRRIKELGIDIDDDDAVRAGSGDVVKGRTFWDKYGPLILGAGGIVGGGLALGALGGGAAASGASGSTAATGSSAAAGGGSAAATGAGVSGGTAAAGGSVGLKAAMNALERGGEVAGNMAAGRADARQAEANYGLDRDRVALDRAALDRSGALDLADLDLRRRESASSLDRDNVKAAILGGLLQGVEDVTIDVPDHIKSRMGTITGGLKPSAIVGREQIGKDLQDRMLPKVKSGETFDPVELSALPELTDAPRSSGLDAALGALGMIGAGAGAYNSIRPSQTRTGAFTQPRGYTPPRPVTNGNTTTGPVRF